MSTHHAQIRWRGARAATSTARFALSVLRVSFLALALLLAAPGCSADDGDAAPQDASASDAGVTDVASPDVVDSDATDTGASQPDAAQTDADQTDTSAGDTTTPPPSTYGLTPARCGLPPYTWLPATQVGDVVSWNEHNLSNLTATGLKALLKTAGLTIPLDGLTHGVRNFRLRYSTQNKGQKTEATAIVSVPTGLPKAATTAPTLLWLHGTSGWNDACAPSTDLSGVGMAAVLAGYGYVVVAPDYLGMRGFGPASPKGTVHPYLINETAALPSLDAVRATAVALAGSASLTNADTQRLLLMGASEGGHAVLATDRFLPHYAPELHEVAAVALVPPANLASTAKQAVAKLSGQAKLLAAMWASMRLWYEAKAPLSEVLRDDPPVALASNLPEWMATTCDVNGKTKALKTIADVYQPGFISALTSDTLAEPWACMLKENSATTMTPPRLRDAPVLMVYGDNDDLVPPAFEEANFLALCKQGYRLRWHGCKDEGHAAAAVKSLPFAMQWLADRLEKKALVAETLCVVQASVTCE